MVVSLVNLDVEVTLAFLSVREKKAAYPYKVGFGKILPGSYISFLSVK